MKHEKFTYKSLDDVKAKCKELGVTIPFADNTECLSAPIRIGNREIPNRLGIAPMEGADSTPDGKPSEYTEKRYTREAAGGAGIIWYEAISIVEEGRSSRTQLLLTRETLDSFKRLNEKVKEAGLKANGFEPFLVMQSNHSGRYSNPDNRPAPLIAQRNAWLETFRAADDSCIVSDDYLKHIEEKTGESALLAREAGFDAVDIKSCHGYLFQEVIAAYDRKGEYGGSYENRTRLLKNSIKAAKAYETPDFQVVSRIGIYDGYPKECRGFGQAPDGSMDLSEPKRLLRELFNDYGLSFVNITMGNPYATTHVVRPFDMGKYLPDEHPLAGVARMAFGIREMKKAVPEMVIYGSAPTYLRQYSDLYVINPKRVCLTCGKCGDLIRAHKPTGCVIREPDVFLPFYKDFMVEKKDLPANFRG